VGHEDPGSCRLSVGQTEDGANSVGDYGVTIPILAKTARACARVREY
jgi:hypothetical protein